VDTPDITCERRRRAHVDVVTAVQQPLDASSQRMVQVNEQLAQQAQLEQQQALQRGPEDLSRTGPRMA
jgi:hypothetical protein